MRILKIVAVAMLASCGAAQADSMTMAMNLGNVLASERPCGLTYDQDAIRAFIEAKVQPGDLGFASTLSMMTTGAEAQISEMSQSQRTAHCAQTRRVAKTYKFISE